MRLIHYRVVLVVLIRQTEIKFVGDDIYLVMLIYLICKGREGKKAIVNYGVVHCLM